MDSQENLKEHLAAIVSSSDDAIVTKNLDSIILSWNQSAERLFGYTAEEAVGQPITMIIPDDRKQEEVEFIAKLRRGERIDHFETIRQRKDGSLIPISVTVSPVRDASGEVVGASKIARDISLQRQVAEQQRLYLSEMRHRVSNSFAVASSLLSVMSRQVETAGELSALMGARLSALADAHRMAVVDPEAKNDSVPLRELIAAIVEPFAGVARTKIDADNLDLASDAITALSLVFYELGTNSVKYGCLGQEGGVLFIDAKRHGERFTICWKEQCNLDPIPEHAEGFGTRLCRSAIQASLGGTISRQFSPNGMSATMDLDLATLVGSSGSWA